MTRRPERDQWPVEKDARLAKLWNSGMPSAAIAEILQISKNAVLGRRLRIGLPSRLTPIKPANPNPHVRKHRKGKKAWEATIEALASFDTKPEPAAPELVETFARPEDVCCRPPIRTERSCQFIIGNRKPPLFCSNVALPKKSFCQHHYEIVYLKKAGMMTVQGLAFS